MDFRAQPIELLKAHNERPPFVRIDSIAFARHQHPFIDVNPLHTHLNALTGPFLIHIIVGDAVDGLDTRFELHWTLDNPRCCDGL